jgi:D-fructose-responsive transcription factor
MSKTAEEISKATGFSITTIRFVLNGQSEKYRISASTQKQINDYIAIHGYSVNHAARSLKLKRSDTIGLVVPDLDNAFFARLMAALEIRCRKRNLLLLTVASHDNPELENRAISTLLARGVDGLVIAPCQRATHPQLIKNKARASVVMFDRDFNPPLFPTVSSDNFQGALLLARRIMKEIKGPCYFLCGDRDLPSIQDRLRGFRAACEELGIQNANELIRLEANNTPEAGKQLMKGMIESLQHPPSAFMCSSLMMLEGALQQIKAETGSIDKDIVIGTFDDHPMLDFLPNRIFAVKQDEQTLAKKVFDRLIVPISERKDSKNLRDVVPTTLICRNLKRRTRSAKSV